MHDDASIRREARSRWPIRQSHLADEPTLDDTTAAQRLAMMWELVTHAWAIAGRTIPDYDRSAAPVRMFRRGEEAGE